MLEPNYSFSSSTVSKTVLNDTDEIGLTEGFFTDKDMNYREYESFSVKSR